MQSKNIANEREYIEMDQTISVKYDFIIKINEFLLTYIRYIFLLFIKEKN